MTGKSYAENLQERIFGPLAMTGSGYDLAKPIIAKRASGYQPEGSGYVNAPYLDMTIPYAAGSIYSTVEDLYVWDRAPCRGRTPARRCSWGCRWCGSAAG